MMTKFPIKRLLLRATAGLVVAAALAACDSDGKVGEGGTGSPPPPDVNKSASGVVTTLGSATVAGVNVNDSDTNIFLNVRGGASAADLRLGMSTDVLGMGPTGQSRVRATTLSAQSLVSGPVDSVSVARRTFDVLGVRVQVDHNTLLDGLTGLEALRPDDVVEVHGLRQVQAGTVLATRVIVRRTSGDSNRVELVGRLDDLFSAWFAPNTVRIDISNATQSAGFGSPGSVSPPAPLTPETAGVLRVRGDLEDAERTIAAREVVLNARPSRADGSEITLDAFVSRLVASNVAVIDGEQVEIDSRLLPPGHALAVGDRVVVSGTRREAVVRAATFQLVARGSLVTYTVEGAVTDYVSSSNLRVRGERIDASAAQFSGGSAGELANGRRIRVSGVAGPGTLSATRVELLP